MATLLDGLLVLSVLFGLGLVQLARAAGAAGDGVGPQSITWAVVYLLFVLLLPLNFCLAWRLFGATPGMWLMGVKLTDAATRGPVSLRQCVLRMAYAGLSAIVLAVGYLWMFVDPRRQCWYDKMARTLVVEEDESTESIERMWRELK